MTPYLIGGQWIILEMVLSASELVDSNPASVCHFGSMAIAFRSEPFCPILVVDYRLDEAGRAEATAKARAIWDQFLTAWKANVASRQAPPLPAPAPLPPDPQPSPHSSTPA